LKELLVAKCRAVFFASATARLSASSGNNVAGIDELHVATQFCFDPRTIVEWLTRTRKVLKRLRAEVVAEVMMLSGDLSNGNYNADSITSLTVARYGCCAREGTSDDDGSTIGSCSSVRSVRRHQNQNSSSRRRRRRLEEACCKLEFHIGLPGPTSRRKLERIADMCEVSFKSYN